MTSLLDGLFGDAGGSESSQQGSETALIDTLQVDLGVSVDVATYQRDADGSEHSDTYSLSVQDQLGLEGLLRSVSDEAQTEEQGGSGTPQSANNPTVNQTYEPAATMNEDGAAAPAPALGETSSEESAGDSAMTSPTGAYEDVGYSPTEAPQSTNGEFDTQIA